MFHSPCHVRPEDGKIVRWGRLIVGKVEKKSYNVSKSKYPLQAEELLGAVRKKKDLDLSSLVVEKKFLIFRQFLLTPRGVGGKIN